MASLLALKTPPSMARPPVKVLVPLSVSVPEPTLVKETIPLPLWIVPLNVPLPSLAPERERTSGLDQRVGDRAGAVQAIDRIGVSGQIEECPAGNRHA